MRSQSGVPPRDASTTVSTMSLPTHSVAMGMNARSSRSRAMPAT